MIAVVHFWQPEYGRVKKNRCLKAAWIISLVYVRNMLDHVQHGCYIRVGGVIRLSSLQRSTQCWSLGCFSCRLCKLPRIYTFG